MKKVKPRPSGSAITTRIIIFLLAAFFALTLGSQIWVRFNDPVLFEDALYYADEESVMFKGVYIRDERRIQPESFAGYNEFTELAATGVVAYTNRCGAKLAINSVVAEVYRDYREILLQRQIEETKTRITTLRDAEAFAGSGDSEAMNNAQIEAFWGQLADVHLRIVRAVGAGEFEAAQSLKNEYLNLQAKINLARGTEQPAQLTAKVAELESKLADLQGQLSGALMQLTVPEAGYFVGESDGYEDVLTFANAAEITAEQLREIIANPSLPQSGRVTGKIIDSYKWRMAALVDSNATKAIAAGSVVRLRIGSHPGVVPALVCIAEEQGDGTTLFVFECELINEEFVRKRVASVRLLLGEYNGIRLPQRAIRFNADGECGVYVLNGVSLAFRKVNILRTEEEYVVAENSGQEDFVRLYDRVVVSGTNLYEGRIVSDERR